MSTLQLEARTAPAEVAFSARELDAAEQLVHLSASSSSSGAPKIAGHAPAASRSSSSPRSVNAPPAPAPARAAAPVLLLLGGCADWEEGEDREVAGSQRRVKRYRPIAEIYAATEEIGGRGGSSRKKE